MKRHLVALTPLASVASLLMTVATPALARPEFSTAISRPTYYSAVGQERSLANHWSYRQGLDRGHNSYQAALQFARCAVRFDPAAADRLLATPFGQGGDRQALARLVEQYRGCTGEISAVAPVLLRAALAETTLPASFPDLKTAPRASVGVPGVVLGFPLLDVARCQLTNAPEQVAKLFKTAPGAASERDAAEALYSSTPACGTLSLGGIQPTVARLGLIEAAYRPK